MVVITGATGLLGSILIEHFLSKNIPVTALYRNNKPNENPGITWREADVTDVQALIEIFKGATCVIHAAALVSFARRNKKKMFNINVDGTANVVNACLQTGVKRLIHISSVAALEKAPNKNIVDEHNQWTGAGNPSNYGQSKYMAELEALRGEAEGLSVALINPSVILAKGNTHRSSGQILQYVNDERPFYTDGHVNYIDARDVSEMVFKLSQNNLRGRFIANAGIVSWKILFHEMATRMGKKPPYIRVTSALTRLAAAAEWLTSSILGKEPLVTRETANLARQNVTYANDKAKRELNISFRDLSETLDWCCSQPAK
jgi:dihydroflavonol-4-reductase